MSTQNQLRRIKSKNQKFIIIEAVAAAKLYENVSQVQSSIIHIVDALETIESGINDTLQLQIVKSNREGFLKDGNLIEVENDELVNTLLQFDAIEQLKSEDIWKIPERVLAAVQEIEKLNQLVIVAKFAKYYRQLTDIMFSTNTRSDEDELLKDLEELTHAQLEDQPSPSSDQSSKKEELKKKKGGK
ncbi:MAG: hypothetical protein EZS28_026159 [Streblomastix strix]|uniref:Uncharacterized protein n=1 Tax=Streblomastix strix TaxID=222440 RepID=A0A5J4V7W5_9EUKA|nr:MAG: hypothetical protein EZS28_026159 [Streblomastix strix]